jgi:hypothetical protein
MRSHLAVAATALIVVSLLGATGASAAWADAQNSDGYAGGGLAGDGAQVVVVVPGASSPDRAYPGGQGRTGDAGGSRIKCWLFRVVPYFDTDQPGIGEVVTDTSSLEPGTMVWFLCRDSTNGDMTFESIYSWDPANPPSLVPTAATLAQMAANRMYLPVPAVRTWPPTSGTGLVNLPVWLHVDGWETISASASAGGLAATVEALPVRVTWDMDEGSVTCTDAGSVYDPVTRPDPTSSTCSFTYRRSSGVRTDLTFHNTAVVVWHLRWYATNGQGGDLGELSSPVAGFDLQIKESQALVAPAGG